MEKLESYQLFNLQHDPGERFNIADKHTDVITEILEMVKTHEATVRPSTSQLDKITAKKGNE